MKRKALLAVTIVMAIFLATACHSQAIAPKSPCHTMLRIEVVKTSSILMLDVAKAVSEKDMKRISRDLMLLDELVEAIEGQGLDKIRRDLMVFSDEVRMLMIEWELDQKYYTGP